VTFADRRENDAEHSWHLVEGAAPFITSVGMGRASLRPP